MLGASPGFLMWMDTWVLWDITNCLGCCRISPRTYSLLPLLEYSAGGDSRGWEWETAYPALGNIQLSQFPQVMRGGPSQARVVERCSPWSACPVAVDHSLQKMQQSQKNTKRYHCYLEILLGNSTLRFSINLWGVVSVHPRQVTAQACASGG